MLHAARNGDYGPLIFYVIVAIFCVAHALDVGKVSSRGEAKLKSGPLGRMYKSLPTRVYRYGPLFGLALITAALLVI